MAWQDSLTFATFTLTNSDLLTPVKYTLRTNGDEELNPGTVASSEVVFDTTHEVVNGSTFSYSVSGASTSYNINNYIVTGVQKKDKKNPNALTVTAYDMTYLFNVEVNGWVDTLVFPITLGNLFGSLCTYIGVSAYSTTFLNSQYSVDDFSDLFTGSLTGRQVLNYIAQLAGGFIVCISDSGVSKLAIRNYANQTSVITSSSYKEFTFEDYELPVIDSVIIGSEDGDVGHRYPATGDVALKIYGNLLSLTMSDSDLNNICQNLYTLYSSYYNLVPGSVSLLKEVDWLGSIDSNSIVRASTLDGTTLYTLPQEIKWDSTGITISCYGESERKAELTPTEQLQVANGRSNVFKRDLDQTVSELTDLEGRMTTATQQPGSFSWLVQDGVSSATFTLTSKAAELATESITLSAGGNTMQTDVDPQPVDGYDRVYYFTQQADGWYYSYNPSDTSSSYTDDWYCRCRVTVGPFTAPTCVRFYAKNTCGQYGSVNTAYMKFSLLDTAYSASTSDSPDLDFVSLDGVSADQEVFVEYTIPGDNQTHFFDIKYVDTSSFPHGDKGYFKQDKESITSSIILNKASGQSVANIELTGLVKFRDLSGNGTTEINGANIVTGTLSADKILGGTLQGAEIYITDSASTPTYYFSVDSRGITNIQNAQQINADNVNSTEIVTAKLNIEDTLGFHNYNLISDIGASSTVYFYAYYNWSNENGKYRLSCELWSDAQRTSVYYFSEPYNIYKEVTFGKVVQGNLRTIKRNIVFTFDTGISVANPIDTGISVSEYPIIAVDGVASLPGMEYVSESQYYQAPAFAPEDNNTVSLGGSSNKWKQVYTNGLNGANFASEPVVAGTYTLQMTIDSYGNKTLRWV